MLRAALVVVIGIVLGALIVWMIMSQVPPDGQRLPQFQMPGASPAGR